MTLHELEQLNAARVEVIHLKAENRKLRYDLTNLRNENDSLESLNDSLVPVLCDALERARAAETKYESLCVQDVQVCLNGQADGTPL